MKRSVGARPGAAPVVFERIALRTTDGPGSPLPLRPPLLLTAVAVLLLFAGLVMSPELLIHLGPMRGSLTHTNPLIRNSSLMEVTIYRVSSIGLFLALVGVILTWKRLIRNPIVLRVADHQIPDVPTRRPLPSFSNVSLVVITASLAVGLLYAALGDRVFDPSILDLVNRNEGLVEQVTALTFLACSVLSAMMAFKMPLERNRRTAHVVLSVGFFLCFGEEISWGQRILDLETIGFIKNINVQGENNIHNLFGYFADRIFFAGVIVYGVILPWLREYHPFWRRSFDLIGLPLPSPGLALGFLAVAILHDWTVYSVLPRGAELNFREFRELLTSLCFLMLMYERWPSAA